MILFITRKYPPSIGGMQQLSYHLTTEVARRRPSRILYWSGSSKLLPVFILVALARAVLLAAKGQVDVVHLGDPVLAPVGFVLQSVFRLPIVVTVHGLDVTYPHALYQLIVPRLLRRFDAVVAISRLAFRECVARGVAPERCYVVPPGVSSDLPVKLSREAARIQIEQRFGVRLGESGILLTTGRLISRKGVAWFVEFVLPIVVEHFPAVRYLVVGDGPERDRIRAATERAGMQGNVVLLGRLDREELWWCYRACDLFVMPNIPVAGDVEGFGLVVLEAGVAERAVVASNLEGIRDAISNGENGILVQTSDVSDWATKIITLLQNDDARDELGRRARVYAHQHFSWSSMADRYLDVFDAARGNATRGEPSPSTST